MKIVRKYRKQKAERAAQRAALEGGGSDKEVLLFFFKHQEIDEVLHTEDEEVALPEGVFYVHDNVVIVSRAPLT